MEVRGDDGHSEGIGSMAVEGLSSAELLPESEGVFSALRLRPRFLVGLAGGDRWKPGAGTHSVPAALAFRDAVGGTEIEEAEAWCRRRGIGAVSELCLVRIDFETAFGSALSFLRSRMAPDPRFGCAFL